VTAIGRIRARFAGSPRGEAAAPARRALDSAFKWFTASCAAVIALITGGILVNLVRFSLPSLSKFGLGFLWSTSWNPVTQEFGAASSIYGTLLSTGLAMLLAVPLSLATAMFLVELAPPRISRVVGGAIELLAAVPSIIFGMWGLFVFAPFMADHIQPFLGRYFGWLPLFKGPPMGIGMLSAGAILGLMILPFVTAVARDVLAMVPPVIKESAYGVGATKWEVTRKVSLRYGMRGIVGAVFLGLGRAIGETMAVTFVIGNDHGISASLFSPGNSIASTLANEFAEAVEPVYLSSLVELGLVLFLVTTAFQVIAHLWLARLHRVVEGRR